MGWKTELRTTCEATLVKNLSDENVVSDVLVIADSHCHTTARISKKCVYIVTVRNPSQVRKSSAWSKLESKSEGIEKLRLEVFEACFNSFPARGGEAQRVVT